MATSPAFSFLNNLQILKMNIHDSIKNIMFIIKIIYLEKCPKKNDENMCTNI